MTPMPSAVARALERIDRLDPALHAFIEVWPDEALAREREAVARRLPLGGLPFAVKGPSGIRSFAAHAADRGGRGPGRRDLGARTRHPLADLGAGRARPYGQPVAGGPYPGRFIGRVGGRGGGGDGGAGDGQRRGRVGPHPGGLVRGVRAEDDERAAPSPDRSGLASAGVLARSAAAAEPYLRQVLDGHETPATASPLKMPTPVPVPVRLALPLPAVYSEDLGFADVDPEVAAVVGRAVDRLVAAGTVRLVERDARLLDPVGAWTAVRGGAPDDPEAVRVRRTNDERLAALLADGALLLTPATPNRPHGHEGPGDFYSTALTWAFNLSGHPAASLPAGFTGDGCPVGLQLVAAHGADLRLLAAARAVEDALPAARRPPAR